MDTLLGILKGVAPALATAVAGPAGGAAVAWIADKLGVDGDAGHGTRGGPLFQSAQARRPSRRQPCGGGIRRDAGEAAARIPRVQACPQAVGAAPRQVGQARGQAPRLVHSRGSQINRGEVHRLEIREHPAGSPQAGPVQVAGRFRRLL